MKSTLNSIDSYSASIDSTSQSLPGSQSFDIPNVSPNLVGIAASTTAVGDAVIAIANARTDSDELFDKLEQEVHADLRSAQADITESLVQISKEAVSC